MIRITVSGQAEQALVLSKLAGALAVEPILDESSAVLLNRIRQRFLEAKDTQGTPWPVSAASRRRTGGKTLYDTGKLFHSIQLASAGANSRFIGTDVEYGPHHQFGTETLPKREFLGFSDEDATVVENLIIKRVIDAIGA